MARLRRIAKWAGFGFAGAIAVAAVALGLAYAYAQSAAGRAWIAEHLGRMLSEPGGIEVAIEGLSGRLPQSPRVAELRVRDADGAWLRVRDLALDWHPFALLAGTLHVSRLEIRQVGFERLPAGAPAAADEQDLRGFERLPLQLKVEGLTVAEVALGEAVLGTPAAFRIEGAATSADATALSAALRITRSDGVPGRIEAEARYGLLERRLTLDLEASEPAGGLIARALDMTGLPAVDLKLAGDGPLDGWNGRLMLAMAGLARLEADIGLTLATDLGFRVRGRAESERAFDALPWRLVSGPTTLAVDGRWRRPGTLVIDQAKLESTAIDLTLAGRLDSESLELAAEAGAQLKDPTALAALVEGAELHDLSVAAEATGSLDAPALRLRAEAASLRLPGMDAGALAVTAESTGSLDAPALRLRAEAASLRLPGVDVGPLALTAETSGPLLQPNLRLAVETARLGTQGVSAEQVTAKIDLALEAPLDREPIAGRVVASGTAEPVRIEAASEWQPALGQRLAWQVEGRVDLGAGEISAERLTVATETLEATGSGQYLFATGAARAELEAEYPDLAALGTLLEVEMAGRAHLAATVTVADFGKTLGAELSAELREPKFREPLTRSLLAGRARVDAALSYTADTGVRVRDLTAETGAARVTGTALLGPDFRRLEASYAAEVADISGPAAALGQALAGSLGIEGRAAGRLDSLELSGTLNLAKAVFDGRRLGELDLAFLARDVPRQPAGRLDATLRGPLGDIHAETLYLFDGTVLDLRDLSLEGLATHVRGHGKIPVAGGPVSAEISIRSETLEPWEALTGLAVTGRGQAQVKLTAAETRQTAALDASVEELTIRLKDGQVLSLAKLTARLASADLLETRRGTAVLTAQDLGLGDLVLRTLRAEAAGGPEGGTASLSAAGEWHGELELRTEGRVSVAPDSLSLQVSRLDGKLFGEPTKLGRPLRISRGDSAWQVADLDLTYGTARLVGAARLGPKRVSADLTAMDFPLAALEPFLATRTDTGLVDASVRIEGPPEALSGRLALAATEVRLAALEGGPVLGLSLNGDWQAGRLALAGRLSGVSEVDAELSATLPLRLDPATLIPVVPTTEALSGQLTWQGPVRPIWAFVPVADQTLAGAAELRVALSGSLARPEVSGRLAIRQGAYENLETGTLLRDLELIIDLDGQRATLTKLAARDGGSGSLSATGAVELLADRGFPMDLSAAFKSFHLLRRDDVTAVSGGRLRLQGSAREAALTGRFETEAVEIRIPDRLPAAIVDLEAVEEDAGPAPVAAPQPGAAEDRPFSLPLDVVVEMPRRVFVRGRGLDSEWAGKLAVTGTVERPEVEGKLEIVRGQVAVIGKTFKFERGNIDFVGGESVDPLLDVKAKHDGPDLSVTVAVAGPASNPGFSLSSDPELPQDEIVSRLLFGKTTTQLSAFEAAQLASAVAELSGVGTGTGVLDGIRRSLGVDVLRVETVGEGEDASAGIAAGKYVTEEIYLGVTQGTGAESGSVEVEVEVSPHIFIDTQVDQTGESNVGIKFKWDY
jgi:translocation and assembly module TamB